MQWDGKSVYSDTFTGALVAAWTRTGGSQGKGFDSFLQYRIQIKMGTKVWQINYNRNKWPTPKPRLNKRAKKRYCNKVSCLPSIPSSEHRAIIYICTTNMYFESTTFSYFNLKNHADSTQLISATECVCPMDLAPVCNSQVYQSNNIFSEYCFVLGHPKHIIGRIHI